MATGWKPVPPPPPQSKIDIDPEKLQAIRDGLWMVVNGAGTGGRARIAGHDVSGKTGIGAGDLEHRARRGRRGTTDKDLRDNGWFVFFAPRDNPQIAGVVFARARHPRRQRRADRASHPRHLLREAGRPAAAAAADRSSTST